MSNVRVAVRARPLSGKEKDSKACCIVSTSGDNLTIQNVKVEGIPEYGDSRDRFKHFGFDYCYDSMGDPQQQGYASQELVFQDLGTEVLQAGIEGYNACLLAYGQTGSGKTYTMMGHPGEIGVIPRIGEGLFSHIDDNTAEKTLKVDVSYLEIYNERVRDLLNLPPPGHVERYTLKVREHPKEGPYVQDLSRHYAKDFHDFQTLLDKGNENRTTAATHMHEHSSRSHAIFTIVYTQAMLEDDIPHEIVSKIHLVDLAGSERADTSYNSMYRGRLKEGANINKSLVTLGNVIKALAEKSLLSWSLDNMGSTHSVAGSSADTSASPSGSPRRQRSLYIPYRDSVLTWLLKDTLGGNSKTIMISTVSPASIYYNETISTLRYAQRAKSIVNKPKVNEDPNVAIIRELRSEITDLKNLLEVAHGVDTTSTLTDRLQKDESLVNQLTQGWMDKWRETHSIMKDTDLSIRGLDRRSSSFGVIIDSQLPHFIGMDEDLLSTGIKIFNLKEGSTYIGREGASRQQDIVLSGPCIKAEHCVVKNHHGEVIIYPRRGASIAINGKDITEPTRLIQGNAVFLGKTHMFRYNNPAEAARLRDHRKSLQDGDLLPGDMLSSMSDVSSPTSHTSAVMPFLFFNPKLAAAEKCLELERTYKSEQEKVEQAKVELEKLNLELENVHQAKEEIEERMWKSHDEKVMQLEEDKHQLQMMIRQTKEERDQARDELEDTRQQLDHEERALKEKFQQEVQKVLSLKGKSPISATKIKETDSATSDSSDDLPVKGPVGKEIRQRKISLEGRLKKVAEKELLSQLSHKVKRKDLESQEEDLETQFEECQLEIANKVKEIKETEALFHKEDVDEYENINSKEQEVENLEMQGQQLKAYIQEKEDLIRVKSAKPRTMRVACSEEKLTNVPGLDGDMSRTQSLQVLQKPPDVLKNLRLGRQIRTNESEDSLSMSQKSDTSDGGRSISHRAKNVTERLYRPSTPKHEYLKKGHASPTVSPACSAERLSVTPDQGGAVKHDYLRKKDRTLPEVQTHKRTKKMPEEMPVKFPYLKKGDGQRSYSVQPYSHSSRKEDSPVRHKHHAADKPKIKKSSSPASQVTKKDGTSQTSAVQTQDANLGLDVPLRRSRPLIRSTSKGSSLPSVPESVEQESADSYMHSAPNVLEVTANVVRRQKRPKPPGWERPKSMPVGAEMATALAEFSESIQDDTGRDGVQYVECASGNSLVSQDSGSEQDMRDRSDSTGTDITVRKAGKSQSSSVDSCKDPGSPAEPHPGHDESPDRRRGERKRQSPSKTPPKEKLPKKMKTDSSDTLTISSEKDKPDIRNVTFPSVENLPVNPSVSDVNDEDEIMGEVSLPNKDVIIDERGVEDEMAIADRSFSVDSLDGDSLEDVAVPVESNHSVEIVPKDINNSFQEDDPQLTMDLNNGAVDRNFDTSLRGIEQATVLPDQLSLDVTGQAADDDHSQLSDESMSPTAVAQKIKTLQEILQRLPTPRTALAATNVNNGRRARRSRPKHKNTDSDSQDQFSDDSLGGSGASRQSSRPDSGSKRRRRPRSFDGTKKRKGDSSDEYQTSDNDSVYSDDSLTHSENKGQASSSKETAQEIANINMSVQQLTADLDTLDSSVVELPVLDLQTVVRRFSESSEGRPNQAGHLSDLDLNSLSDTNPVKVTSDFAQTEGASVKMRLSPVNVWSSDGESFIPMHSEKPLKSKDDSKPSVVSRSSEKPQNLSVTPTEVWNSDPVSSNSNTGHTTSGPLGQSELDQRRIVKGKRGQSSGDRVKYEVTINEDNTNIMYNVEKTEYRTYGLKKKNLSDSETESIPPVIPDTISINLTDTKTYQKADRFESVTKEKVLMLKQLDDSVSPSGVITSEKLSETSHSLSCEEMQDSSGGSRGSSVERTLTEENFTSKADAYPSTDDPKHVDHDHLTHMDTTDSVFVTGDHSMKPLTSSEHSWTSETNSEQQFEKGTPALNTIEIPVYSSSVDQEMPRINDVPDSRTTEFQTSEMIIQEEADKSFDISEDSLENIYQGDTSKDDENGTSRKTGWTEDQESFSLQTKSELMNNSGEVVIDERAGAGSALHFPPTNVALLRTAVTAAENQHFDHDKETLYTGNVGRREDLQYLSPDTPGNLDPSLMHDAIGVTHLSLHSPLHVHTQEEYFVGAPYLSAEGTFMAAERNSDDATDETRPLSADSLVSSLYQGHSDDRAIQLQTPLQVQIGNEPDDMYELNNSGLSVILEESTDEETSGPVHSEGNGSERHGSIVEENKQKMSKEGSLKLDHVDASDLLLEKRDEEQAEHPPPSEKNFGFEVIHENLTSHKATELDDLKFHVSETVQGPTESEVQEMSSIDGLAKSSQSQEVVEDGKLSRAVTQSGIPCSNANSSSSYPKSSISKNAIRTQSPEEDSRYSTETIFVDVLDNSAFAQENIQFPDAGNFHSTDKGTMAAKNPVKYPDDDTLQSTEAMNILGNSVVSPKFLSDDTHEKGDYTEMYPEEDTRHSTETIFVNVSDNNRLAAGHLPDGAYEKDTDEKSEEEIQHSTETVVAKVSDCRKDDQVNQGKHFTNIDSEGRPQYASEQTGTGRTRPPEVHHVSARGSSLISPEGTQYSEETVLESVSDSRAENTTYTAHELSDEDSKDSTETVMVKIIDNKIIFPESMIDGRSRLADHQRTDYKVAEEGKPLYGFQSEDEHLPKSPDKQSSEEDSRFSTETIFVKVLDNSAIALENVAEAQGRNQVRLSPEDGHLHEMDTFDSTDSKTSYPVSDRAEEDSIHSSKTIFVNDLGNNVLGVGKVTDVAHEHYKPPSAGTTFSKETTLAKVLDNTAEETKTQQSAESDILNNDHRTDASGFHAVDKMLQKTQSPEEDNRHSTETIFVKVLGNAAEGEIEILESKSDEKCSDGNIWNTKDGFHTKGNLSRSESLEDVRSSTETTFVKVLDNESENRIDSENPFSANNAKERKEQTLLDMNNTDTAGVVDLPHPRMESPEDSRYSTKTIFVKVLGNAAENIGEMDTESEKRDNIGRNMTDHQHDARISKHHSSSADGIHADTDHRKMESREEDSRFSTETIFVKVLDNSAIALENVAEAQGRNQVRLSPEDGHLHEMDTFDSTDSKTSYPVSDRAEEDSIHSSKTIFVNDLGNNVLGVGKVTDVAHEHYKPPSAGTTFSKETTLAKVLDNTAEETKTQQSAESDILNNDHRTDASGFHAVDKMLQKTQSPEEDNRHSTETIFVKVLGNAAEGEIEILESKSDEKCSDGNIWNTKDGFHTKGNLSRSESLEDVRSSTETTFVKVLDNESENRIDSENPFSANNAKERKEQTPLDMNNTDTAGVVDLPHPRMESPEDSRYSTKTIFVKVLGNAAENIGEMDTESEKRDNIGRNMTDHQHDARISKHHSSSADGIHADTDHRKMESREEDSRYSTETMFVKVLSNAAENVVQMDVASEIGDNSERMKKDPKSDARVSRGIASADGIRADTEHLKTKSPEEDSRYSKETIFVNVLGSAAENVVQMDAESKIRDNSERMKTDHRSDARVTRSSVSADGIHVNTEHLKTESSEEDSRYSTETIFVNVLGNAAENVVQMDAESEIGDNNERMKKDHRSDARVTRSSVSADGIHVNTEHLKTESPEEDRRYSTETIFVNVLGNAAENVVQMDVASEIGDNNERKKKDHRSDARVSRSNASSDGNHVNTEHLKTESPEEDRRYSTETIFVNVLGNAAENVVQMDVASEIGDNNERKKKDHRSDARVSRSNASSDGNHVKTEHLKTKSPEEDSRNSTETIFVNVLGNAAENVVQMDAASEIGDINERKKKDHRSDARASTSSASADSIHVDTEHLKTKSPEEDSRYSTETIFVNVLGNAAENVVQMDAESEIGDNNERMKKDHRSDARVTRSSASADGIHVNTEHLKTESPEEDSRYSTETIFVNVLGNAAENVVQMDVASEIGDNNEKMNKDHRSDGKVSRSNDSADSLHVDSENLQTGSPEENRHSTETIFVKVLGNAAEGEIEILDSRSDEICSGGDNISNTADGFHTKDTLSRSESPEDVRYSTETTFVKVLGNTSENRMESENPVSANNVKESKEPKPFDMNNTNTAREVDLTHPRIESPEDSRYSTETIFVKVLGNAAESIGDMDTESEKRDHIGRNMKDHQHDARISKHHGSSADGIHADTEHLKTKPPEEDSRYSTESIFVKVLGNAAENVVQMEAESQIGDNSERMKTDHRPNPNVSMSSASTDGTHADTEHPIMKEEEDNRYLKETISVKVLGNTAENNVQIMDAEANKKDKRHDAGTSGDCIHINTEHPRTESPEEDSRYSTETIFVKVLGNTPGDIVKVDAESVRGYNNERMMKDHQHDARISKHHGSGADGIHADTEHLRMESPEEDSRYSTETIFVKVLGNTSENIVHMMDDKIPKEDNHGTIKGDQGHDARTDADGVHADTEHQRTESPEDSRHFSETVFVRNLGNTSTIVPHILDVENKNYDIIKQDAKEPSDTVGDEGGKRPRSSVSFVEYENFKDIDSVKKSPEDDRIFASEDMVAASNNMTADELEQNLSPEDKHFEGKSFAADDSSTTYKPPKAPGSHRIPDAIHAKEDVESERNLTTLDDGSRYSEDTILVKFLGNSVFPEHEKMSSVDVANGKNRNGVQDQNFLEPHYSVDDLKNRGQSGTSSTPDTCDLTDNPDTAVFNVSTSWIRGPVTGQTTSLQIPAEKAKTELQGLQPIGYTYLVERNIDDSVLKKDTHPEESTTALSGKDTPNMTTEPSAGTNNLQADLLMFKESGTDKRPTVQSPIPDGCTETSDDVYLSFEEQSRSGTSSSTYTTPHQSPRDIEDLQMQYLHSDLLNLQRGALNTERTDSLKTPESLRPTISVEEPHKAYELNDESRLADLVANLNKLQSAADKSALYREVEEEIKTLRNRARRLSDSAISSDFTDLESPSPRMMDGDTAVRPSQGDHDDKLALYEDTTRESQEYKAAEGEEQHSAHLSISSQIPTGMTDLNGSEMDSQRKLDHSGYNQGNRVLSRPTDSMNYNISEFNNLHEGTSVDSADFTELSCEPAERANESKESQDKDSPIVAKIRHSFLEPGKEAVIVMQKSNALLEAAVKGKTTTEHMKPGTEYEKLSTDSCDATTGRNRLQHDLEEKHTLPSDSLSSKKPRQSKPYMESQKEAVLYKQADSQESKDRAGKQTEYFKNNDDFQLQGSSSVDPTDIKTPGKGEERSKSYQHRGDKSSLAPDKEATQFVEPSKQSVGHADGKHTSSLETKKEATHFLEQDRLSSEQADGKKRSSLESTKRVAEFTEANRPSLGQNDVRNRSGFEPEKEATLIMEPGKQPSSKQMDEKKRSIFEPEKDTTHFMKSSALSSRQVGEKDRSSLGPDEEATQFMDQSRNLPDLASGKKKSSLNPEKEVTWFMEPDRQSSGQNNEKNDSGLESEKDPKHILDSSRPPFVQTDGKESSNLEPEFMEASRHSSEWDDGKNRLSLQPDKEAVLLMDQSRESLKTTDSNMSGLAADKDVAQFGKPSSYLEKSMEFRTQSPKAVDEVGKCNEPQKEVPQDTSNLTPDEAAGKKRSTLEPSKEATLSVQQKVSDIKPQRTAAESLAYNHSLEDDFGNSRHMLEPIREANESADSDLLPLKQSSEKERSSLKEPQEVTKTASEPPTKTCSRNRLDIEPQSEENMTMAENTWPFDRPVLEAITEETMPSELGISKSLSNSKHENLVTCSTDPRQQISHGSTRRDRSILESTREVTELLSPNSQQVELERQASEHKTLRQQLPPEETMKAKLTLDPNKEATHLVKAVNQLLESSDDSLKATLSETNRNKPYSLGPQEDITLSVEPRNLQDVKESECTDPEKRANREIQEGIHSVEQKWQGDKANQENDRIEHPANETSHFSQPGISPSRQTAAKDRSRLKDQEASIEVMEPKNQTSKELGRQSRSNLEPQRQTSHFTESAAQTLEDSPKRNRLGHNGEVERYHVMDSRQDPPEANTESKSSLASLKEAGQFVEPDSWSLDSDKDRSSLEFQRMATEEDKQSSWLHQTSKSAASNLKPTQQATLFVDPKFQKSGQQTDGKHKTGFATQKEASENLKPDKYSPGRAVGQNDKGLECKGEAEQKRQGLQPQQEVTRFLEPITSGFEVVRGGRSSVTESLRSVDSGSQTPRQAGSMTGNELQEDVMAPADPHSWSSQETDRGSGSKYQPRITEYLQEQPNTIQMSHHPHSSFDIRTRHPAKKRVCSDAWSQTDSTMKQAHVNAESQTPAASVIHQISGNQGLNLVSPLLWHENDVTDESKNSGRQIVLEDISSAATPNLPHNNLKRNGSRPESIVSRGLQTDFEDEGQVLVGSNSSSKDFGNDSVDHISSDRSNAFTLPGFSNVEVQTEHPSGVTEQTQTYSHKTAASQTDSNLYVHDQETDSFHSELRKKKSFVDGQTQIHSFELHENLSRQPPSSTSFEPESKDQTAPNSVTSSRTLDETTQQEETEETKEGGYLGRLPRHSDVLSREVEDQPAPTISLNQDEGNRHTDHILTENMLTKSYDDILEPYDHEQPESEESDYSALLNEESSQSLSDSKDVMTSVPDDSVTVKIIPSGAEVTVNSNSAGRIAGHDLKVGLHKDANMKSKKEGVTQTEHSKNSHSSQTTPLQSASSQTPSMNLGSQMADSQMPSDSVLQTSDSQAIYLKTKPMNSSLQLSHSLANSDELSSNSQTIYSQTKIIDSKFETTQSQTTPSKTVSLNSDSQTTHSSMTHSRMKPIDSSSQTSPIHTAYSQTSQSYSESSWQTEIVDDILSDNSETPCGSPSFLSEIIEDDSLPSEARDLRSYSRQKRNVSRAVEALVDSSDEFTQTDLEDSFLESRSPGRKNNKLTQSYSSDSARIQTELERLERERIEIIELLSLNYLPSSLTVELLEAKMNYCIGQTDMLLASLEDSWDKEYSDLTNSSTKLDKKYLRQYKSLFKKSKREMEACIDTRQRQHSGGRGRRKARNSDTLKMERRAQIEAFKLERMREQQMYRRARSFSPTKAYTPVVVENQIRSFGARHSTSVPKYMTPREHSRHLVDLRRSIVHESEDELHQLRSRSVSPHSDSRFSLNSSRESSFSPERSLSSWIQYQNMRPHSISTVEKSCSSNKRSESHLYHSAARHSSLPITVSYGMDPESFFAETAIIRQLNQRQIDQAQASLREFEARRKRQSKRVTSSPRLSVSSSHHRETSPSSYRSISQQAIDAEIESLREEHDRSRGSSEYLHSSQRSYSSSRSSHSYAAYARDHLARSERRIQTIINPVPASEARAAEQDGRCLTPSPVPSVISDLHSSVSESPTYQSFVSNLTQEVSLEETRYSRTRPVSSKDVKARIQTRIKKR